MIRRPPRSTLDRSSAASDVYKRQAHRIGARRTGSAHAADAGIGPRIDREEQARGFQTVSYTHLRAHETVLDIVCRLLLEKKKASTISVD